VAAPPLIHSLHIANTLQNMSLSTEYLHGIDHSDPPTDDDLDLEELDPASAGNHHGPRASRDHNRQASGYGARIALRTLRTRNKNRLWSRDSTARHQSAENELDSLFDDRDDIAFNQHEDDAPLLSGQRRSETSFDGRRSTKSRLPSFRSANAPSQPAEESPSTAAAREVLVGQTQHLKFPANAVSNAKYTPWSFLPRTLYNEFSFFFNLYFLFVALSQVIPVLRIGFLSSYIAPLAFVVAISLGKEAWDDIGRRRRDAEANAEEFTILSFGPPAGGNARGTTRSAVDTALDEGVYEITKKSRDLKVGEVLKIKKDQRLPADVVILKSTLTESSVQIRQPDAVGTLETSEVNLLESSSEIPETEGTVNAKADDMEDVQTSGTSDTFIRTDQLDGETDWKLRLPAALTQNLDLRDLKRLKIHASAPDKRVNEFLGKIELLPPRYSSYDPPVSKTTTAPDNDVSNDAEDFEAGVESAPLGIDNTAWANTVLASNTVTFAVIIYTGPQTRSAMSISPSRSKIGLLEYEINNLTKILCALTLLLSIVLVALEGFEPTNDKKWYVAIMIYLILYSTIIPMSLRVNLDMAKTIYGRFIERDQDIPGTVVRTSTIPEDLGRIEYLLSDKTGTLTQNGKSSAINYYYMVTDKSRNGTEKDSRWNCFICQRGHGRSCIIY
jgi:phospholipid-translocating ATPase